jgi:hypothetical protein
MQFQKKCRAWFEACYGRLAPDRAQRLNSQALERAVEIFQAHGGDRAHALRLIDYVFCAPPRDRRETVGDSIMALALLCEATDTSMIRQAKRRLDIHNAKLAPSLPQYEQAPIQSEPV